MTKINEKCLTSFLLENYPDDIKTIAEDGCQGGIHGMITYHDTGLLYDKFVDDIWMIINDHVQPMGETIMTFIDNPNYGKDITIVDNETFKNYMLWAAVEIVCSNIVYDIEEGEAEEEGGAE